MSDCEMKTLTYILQSYSIVRHKPSSVAALRQSYIARMEGLKTTIMPQESLRFVCKYCHHPWIEGSFTIKVLPRPVLGKHIKKLLRKKERAPEKLSQYQKNLIEFVKKNKGNKFVLTCLVCKKKIIKEMNQFKHDIPNEEFEKEEEETSKPKKKKKKRKDIFAGLNPEIVWKSSLKDTTTPLSTFKQTNLKSSLVSHKNHVDILKKKRVNTEVSSLKEQNKKRNVVPSDQKNKINIFNQNSSTSVTNITKNQKRGYFQQLELSRKQEYVKKKNMEKKSVQLKKMLHGQLLNKQTKTKVTDFHKVLREFGNPADF